MASPQGNFHRRMARYDSVMNRKMAHRSANSARAVRRIIQPVPSICSPSTRRLISVKNALKFRKKGA